MGQPIRHSLQEYARGIAGGLLFSLPLLYTMEVWWAGFVSTPQKLLVHLGVTMLLLLGFNKYVGLREDANGWEVAIDSVEELGIGLILSALILFLLGRIQFDQNWPEAIGKIVLEGSTAAIGVSVGTAQLGENPETEGKNHRPIKFLGQIVIAVCGAVIVAANVGPTEEILMIAVELSPVLTLSLVVFSMILAVVILKLSDFKGARDFTSDYPIHPFLFSGVVTYAIAMTVSLYLLWFFGRLDGASSGIVASQMVVLGFPGILGATAGRLLLQT